MSHKELAMARTIEADVIIAGAGTTGAYLAWRLSEAGYRCVVLEAQPLETLGTCIGPFHMEEIAFDRFGLPLPEGDELLHVERRQTMWAPGQEHCFRFEFPVFVMDKPLFIRRLHGYAREAGAEIIERSGVVDVILERGFPRGLRSRGEAGDIEAWGRLVIDASGLEGAVRTLMPWSRWLENEPLSNRDTIFVYMETWRDISGELPPGVNSHPYFQGWCAPGPGDTRIVGIGMTGSYAAARKRHRDFVGRLPFEGTVQTSTEGRIPYRRPPFSLVDNGLLVAGDAAFMNKPFSGEGVSSAFTACLMAIDVAVKALSRDDLTRESLWRYNTLYFRDQGAKFAFLTAVLPAVMGVSEEEMDLFFSVPGLLTESGALAMQEDFEIESDPAAAIKALPQIAGGLLKGSVRASTLASLARAGAAASRLKKLYLRFPDHPMEFAAWLEKAAPLWKVAEAMKYRYFETVAGGR